MSDTTILAILDPTSRGEQPVVESAARPQRVPGRLPCDLLIVKPDGFEQSLPHIH